MDFGRDILFWYNNILGIKVISRYLINNYYIGT